MLINRISAEFKELNEVIEDKLIFMRASRLIANSEKLGKNLLLMSADIRRISQIEVTLKNKRFESKIVQEISDDCINCINNIFKQYDEIARVISVDELEGGIRLKAEKEEKGIVLKVEKEEDMAKAMFEAIKEWEKVCSKAKLANEIVSRIMKEMWEPLPDDKEEDNVNNIIVSSETRSMSLSNVASDVDSLNRFLNSICFLIGQEKNEDNSIYLRKVETGSLTVAVSCVIGIAPIIKFMFWVIELCQNTAERSLSIEEKSLNNKEKKLKIINDEIDAAKKIFEIQPDNKVADELIQGCAIHLLEFLENNPTGTINGKHYDTGIEKLKIEDKEKMSN